MPDAAGRTRGIRVPRVPWHHDIELREFGEGDERDVVAVRCSCGWSDIVEGFEAYMGAEESALRHREEAGVA